MRVCTNNDAWQSGTLTLANGSFHCIHWVFDSGDYFYADGIFDVFRADNIPTAANAVGNIGATPTGAYGFQGFIDTVIVHIGYAPSATEVSQMYGETHPWGVP